MEIISGVYEIRNIVNGHRYIGSSVNIYKRWREHEKSLLNNKHHSIYLQRAYNLYGKESMSFSIIEECCSDNLIKIEQFYMDTSHPEYNIYPIAGSSLGVKQSDETKRKVSAAGKGRVFTEEHKQKISLSNKGKIVSEQTRKKIGEKSKGRFFSKASREKMSMSGKMREHKKGYTLSKERKLEISASLIGNKYCVGRIPWNKGIIGKQVLLEETKRKMSEAQKERRKREHANE